MALRVLTALDQARIQWFHFKAIMIAGMGTFTDAYDLFCVAPVMKLIGRIYYKSHDGKPGDTPPAVISAIVSIALAGTAIGQLVFGAVGDQCGRRRVYGISLLIMVLSSFCCGFSICRTRNCVLGSLCLFRFVLGLGIGGDYPLSATIMSEFASKRTRGSFIAAVFSMQGFGILASSAVTMVLATIFNRATKSSEISPLQTPEAADILWRVILMIGAIPAALTFYWRMTMPETARYTALVEQDVIKATNDIRHLGGVVDLPSIDEDMEFQEQHHSPPRPRPAAPFGLFSKEFLRLHGRHLFACSSAWFLVDIPFYSSTLFQSRIYQPKFPESQKVNAYMEAYNVAKFQAVIAAASTIPGYWATVYFIDRVGRRKIQMMGFFFMAVFLFALAWPYDKYWSDHTNWWFIVLYGLTNFFTNFGPNTTTFIVPAELFPARLRSTCHGISGASGKVGAIIGAIGFLWASQTRRKEKLERGWQPGIGMMYSLVILGGICVIGVVVTYLFTPETKWRSLELNENDVHQQPTGNGVESVRGLELHGDDESLPSQRDETPLRSHAI